MSISMHTLKPAHGSRTKKFRIGRGNASGRGTTAGRGTKGQRARAGGRNKLKVKSSVGTGFAPVAPYLGGNMIGTEVNLNLCYTLRVFMDLELHASYLKLGDFFDSPEINNMETPGRPQDPWTIFATLKWIMF